MLTADQQVKHLGSIKFGVPVKFDYTLTNTTTTPIQIKKVVLSCNSCTVATLSKSLLQAGESGKLNTMFTPGATGLNSKSIQVLYDHQGSEHNLTLKFKSEIHE